MDVLQQLMVEIAQDGAVVFDAVGHAVQEHRLPRCQARLLCVAALGTAIADRPRHRRRVDDLVHLADFGAVAALCVTGQPFPALEAEQVALQMADRRGQLPFAPLALGDEHAAVIQAGQRAFCTIREGIRRVGGADVVRK